MPFKDQPNKKKPKQVGPEKAAAGRSSHWSTLGIRAGAEPSVISNLMVGDELYSWERELLLPVVRELLHSVLETVDEERRSGRREVEEERNS